MHACIKLQSYWFQELDFLKQPIFQELLKCDTEAQSEQMLLEKLAPIDFLVDTNLQYVKNEKSEKWNKTKCACISGTLSCLTNL